MTIEDGKIYRNISNQSFVEVESFTETQVRYNISESDVLNVFDSSIIRFLREHEELE